MGWHGEPWHVGVLSLHSKEEEGGGGGRKLRWVGTEILRTLEFRLSILKKKEEEEEGSLDRLARSLKHRSLVYDSDVHNGSADHTGSFEKDEKNRGGSLMLAEILKRLKRYGISGILSYGLLNTVYYLTAFLLVWFYVAPAPGKMGYMAAVERFLKIMAMVWAGSQVTKLVRAGGALALAPVVDRGLSWFTAKFKFESQGKAFMVVVGFCFGLAVVLFLIVTLLWA
ncbi:hypothetical protein NMG60_11029651 [Bertholletia excelsa]